jgi:hypothetical protein
MSQQVCAVAAQSISTAELTSAVARVRCEGLAGGGPSQLIASLYKLMETMHY